MSSIQSDIEQYASRAEMSGFPHESDSSLEGINGIQQRTNNYFRKIYKYMKRKYKGVVGVGGLK